MSSTGQDAPHFAAEHTGRTRKTITTIGALAVVVVLVVLVAVLALRARNPAPPPAATPAQAVTATPSTAAATPSAGSSGAGAATIADGCLGGPSDLDQAVVSAQHQVALSAVGAATFTASLMRWAFTGPPPPLQAKTAGQILTAHASSAARAALSSSKNLEGSSGTLDFTAGKYYVESFGAGSAVVSYLATGHVADHGAPQPDVLLAGTVHLQAVDGVWRFADFTADRGIEDLQLIGVPYAGGC